MAFLHYIIRDTEKEVAAAKKKRSIGDLKRMIQQAAPVRPFNSALSKGHGIIAEIKRRSPSAGEMREDNFNQAPIAYKRSSIVRAVSVLTNSTHFGMGIEDLSRIKSALHQPILRKDFILTEYQIYESRAFGADAVLLMANVLNADKLLKFFNLSRTLGLHVLFEAHTEEEIERIPKDAEIYGINSRKFMASKRWYLAKMFQRFGLWQSGKGPDPSVELQAFSLIQHLPKNSIKIAESGVRPTRISEVIGMGFDAVLVGTSLLKDPAGIEQALQKFEQALAPARGNFNSSPVVVPA